MSELAEKRKVFRSEIRRPVLYRRKAPGPIKAGVGWTHNLSDEGACLELSDRLEESSAIQLLFQTDHGGLAVGAVVIWAAALRQRGEGILHGVSFPDLTPDQRQALHELLHSIT
jgi:hypothetical protein